MTTPAPNVVWLTDITEHRTGEGKLYLCAIKDACSKRIVGYSMDSRMTAALAVSALRNAIALRDPAGTIAHSDRGSQFRSHAFVRTVRHNGLVGSMGRVGACGDNAAMESFFSLLQKERLGPSSLVDTRRTPPRDRDLHRTDVSPSASSTSPGAAHPDRV
jgi:putative transposase